MLADANAILRIFLNDIPEQKEIVLNQLKKDKIKIPNEVIAEVVYVLSVVYKVSREEIAGNMAGLLDSEEIISEPLQLLALSIFHNENLDIVDCFLLANNYLYNEEILTFDKRLLSKLK